MQAHRLVRIYEERVFDVVLEAQLCAVFEAEELQSRTESHGPE